MNGNNQPKSFKYKAKATLLFIGQSLLFCLGFISMILIFLRFFESNFSFAELSLLEILFSLALFFVVSHYVNASKATGLPWTQMLYRPLRLIGLLSLIGFLYLLVMISINSRNISLQVFSINNSMRIQWVCLILIPLCFYWSTPKVSTAVADEDAKEKEEVVQ